MLIKINGTTYPAVIDGILRNPKWDGRDTKKITLEMDYEQAASLFVDDLAWSIVDEDSGAEWDNSDYSVAGDIVDHRDGTVTVKIGRVTPLEQAYELLYGSMPGGDE